MPRVLVGGYCPLCGDMNLQVVKYKRKDWAFCPQGATGPKDAHTAYEVPDDRTVVEMDFDAPAEEAAEEASEPAEEPVAEWAEESVEIPPEEEISVDEGD